MSAEPQGVIPPAALVARPIFIVTGPDVYRLKFRDQLRVDDKPMNQVAEPGLHSLTVGTEDLGDDGQEIYDELHRRIGEAVTLAWWVSNAPPGAEPPPDTTVWDGGES